MLKDRVKQFFEEENIELFQVEKEYADQHGLGLNDLEVDEKKAASRFLSAHIERCDKEYEKVMGEESASFLNEKIAYLKKNKTEFVYMESDWFDLLGIDALSIEADDVFGTYDIMLGLKLQKKHERALKDLFTSRLQGDETKFDMLFSNEDGLWNINFALNSVEGFHEDMTFSDAYGAAYRLLFEIVAEIEAQR